MQTVSDVSKALAAAVESVLSAAAIESSSAESLDLTADVEF